MKLKNALAAALLLGVSNLIATSAPVSAGQQDSKQDPQIPFDRAWQHDDGTITFRGKVFASWHELHASMPAEEYRCGAPLPILPGAQWGQNLLQGEGGIAGATASGDDCSMTLSSLSGGLYTYNIANGNFGPLNPLGKIEIPVVVHIIRNNAGTQGEVSDAAVAAQITRLNTDYTGGAGAPGGPNPSGVNTGISFRLVKTLRYDNTQWFNDAGDYYTANAWDTSRFLNIYTNTAGGGGTLGYVAGFAAEGCYAGTSADRIVVNFEYFGNPTAGGTAPYNLGRTLTHESGHYFGLFHTFQGSCGAAAAPDCYGENDLICDTQPEDEPHFGCAAAATCGNPDPINNFMNYSDDTCMTQFTSEQSQRMRCTLLTWRAGVAHTPSAANGPTYINASTGDAAMTVTWGTTTPTGAGAQTGFELQRKLSTEPDAAYVLIDGNLSATTLSYIDAGAQPFLTYDYRVRAKLGAGAPSGWTAGARGSVGFAGPTDVMASDFDYSDRVDISWTAPTGYTPSAYRILRGEQGGCEGDVIATIPASETTFSDFSAEARVLYTYSVQAEVASGAASFSGSDGGARAIPAPYNLLASGEVGSATPPATNRITVSWTLPFLTGNSPVNRVYVYRSIEGGPLEQVTILNTASTQWSDTSVFSDTRYDYSVRLFSALLGLSGYSNTDMGFALEAPAVASASDGTPGSVLVRWSRPASWNPISYSVWRKPQGRAPWPDAPIATNLSANTFQFTDFTAQSGGLYVYAVTAKSATFNTWSERGRVDTGYPAVLPPSNVAASDGTFPAYVRITWTPLGITSGVSWEIYRRIRNTNTSFTRIKTVTTPVHLDATAAVGVQYDYYVVTRLPNGVLSAPSAIDVGFR